MCLRCDALLCPLHTGVYQLAHQQCRQCVHRGRRRARQDESGSDSDHSASTADDWDSDSPDNSADEDSDREPPTNTWFTQPHLNKRIRHCLDSKPGHSDDKCAICLDAMSADTQVVQLPCVGKHAFHTPCITQWLSTHSTCPLCLNAVYVFIHS